MKYVICEIRYIASLQSHTCKTKVPQSWLKESDERLKTLCAVLLGGGIIKSITLPNRFITFKTYL